MSASATFVIQWLHSMRYWMPKRYWMPETEETSSVRSPASNHEADRPTDGVWLAAGHGSNRTAYGPHRTPQSLQIDPVSQTGVAFNTTSVIMPCEREIHTYTIMICGLYGWCACFVNVGHVEWRIIRPHKIRLLQLLMHSLPKVTYDHHALCITHYASCIMTHSTAQTVICVYRSVFRFT